MHGSSLCTLLMSQLSDLELLHGADFIDLCRVVRCCVAGTHTRTQINRYTDVKIKRAYRSALMMKMMW